jgi:hypothetical protein
MDDPFEWQDYKDKVDELTRKFEELKGQVKEDLGKEADDTGPMFTGRSHDMHRREVVMHYVEGLNEIAKGLNDDEEVSIGNYEELRGAFEKWVKLCEAPGKMEVQQGDMMVGTIGEQEVKIYCFVTVADEGSFAGFQNMGPSPYAGSDPWSYHIWSSASSEAESCECESGVSTIGSGSWVVEDEEGCGKFTVLTSIEETSDSEGTTLDIKKRDVHVDKCGKVLELGSETSESILIPCCEEEEEEPPCPVENPTYTVEWKTWFDQSGAFWDPCRKTYNLTDYRPFSKGTTVYTRVEVAAGGYQYQILSAADNQAGSYVNCNEPAMVNTGTAGNSLGYSGNAWNLNANWFLTIPACSPIGSYENGNGVWHKEITIS